MADGARFCTAPYAISPLTSRGSLRSSPPRRRSCVKFSALQRRAATKIANYLTDQCVPTPRMSECAGIAEKRRARASNARAKSGVGHRYGAGHLDNDFYIGTPRQGKYTAGRSTISMSNGTRATIWCSEHHHQGCHRLPHLCHHSVPWRQQRTTSHYRGCKDHRQCLFRLRVR